MRKRVTVRPGRASGVAGGIGGGVFVLIGLFYVIPTFGLFGIFWTLLAVVIAVSSLYTAFGRRYTGPEIHIEDETPDAPPAASDTAARLQQLQGLYDQGLITRGEYDKKREEILREL